MGLSVYVQKVHPDAPRILRASSNMNHILQPLLTREVVIAQPLAFEMGPSVPSFARERLHLAPDRYRDRSCQRDHPARCPTWGRTRCTGRNSSASLLRPELYFLRQTLLDSENKMSCCNQYTPTVVGPQGPQGPKGFQGQQGQQGPQGQAGPAGPALAHSYLYTSTDTIVQPVLGQWYPFPCRFARKIEGEGTTFVDVASYVITSRITHSVDPDGNDLWVMTARLAFTQEGVNQWNQSGPLAGTSLVMLLPAAFVVGDTTQYVIVGQASLNTTLALEVAILGESRIVPVFPPIQDNAQYAVLVKPNGVPFGTDDGDSLSINDILYVQVNYTVLPALQEAR